MPLSASTHSPLSSASDGQPGGGEPGARLEQRVALEGRLVLHRLVVRARRRRGRAPRCRERARARIRRISSIFLALRDARNTRGLSHRRQRLPLDPGQVGAALLREGEQRVELGAVERRALGGALHLDELAVAGHHDVHVGLGADVLLVGQVEPRHAVDDADPDRGHRAGQRLARRAPRPTQVGHGVGEGDVRPGDRRGAGAAVGLEHVAVEHDRVLPERLVVDHRTQRAADQPGDLVGAAADAALDRLAVRAGVGGGGSMAYSAVTQPRPEPLRQRGTPSEAEAAQSTRVRPNSTSTEPAGWSSQWRVILIGRSSSSARPSARDAVMAGRPYRRPLTDDAVGPATSTSARRIRHSPSANGRPAR